MLANGLGGSFLLPHPKKDKQGGPRKRMNQRGGSIVAFRDFRDGGDDDGAQKCLDDKLNGHGWGNLEFCGGVFAFENGELLFDRLQLRGELVQVFETSVLRFSVTEVRNCRMNFHERLHNGAGGIADLLNGGGAFHGGNLEVDASLQGGGFECVLHQHGDGHRTDAAGDGGDGVAFL